MVEVNGSRTQTITDIANGLALCELAEKHRDQVRPASEAFLMFVGFSLIDQFIENATVQL